MPTNLLAVAAVVTLEAIAAVRVPQAEALPPLSGSLCPNQVRMGALICECVPELYAATCTAANYKYICYGE